MKSVYVQNLSVLILYLNWLIICHSGGTGGLSWQWWLTVS